MQREAQRTLLSLSRRYQQGLDDAHYEVLCIDNGSAQPMDRRFVESFGREFRLIRPEPALPSACKAINDAVKQARGRYVCIMIDGAHMLSPNVLSQALEAFKGYPDAMVALRQWFIGGDQRWLAQNGYTREMEDQLFARCEWPHDPYALFDIGRAMHDPAGGWYQGMGESNCVLLPISTYRQIGGYDELFDEPGAGYANLDFFVRAAAAVRGPIISMLGEASFHQFHGGTTTNVPDRDKDRLVSQYNQKFRQLRTHAFTPVAADQLLFFGRVRSRKSQASEARPLFAIVPLTDKIKRGTQRGFDRGRSIHLLSNYVEEGMAHTQWLGQSLDLFPADLVAIQEIFERVRPECIVMPNATAALVNFVDSIVRLIDIQTRIVWPAVDADCAEGSFAAVHSVRGDPATERVLAEVRSLSFAYDRILVLYSISAASRFSPTSLSPYARLVSPGSYLAVLGTARGRPFIGYSTYDAGAVLRKMMEGLGGFAIDYSWEHRHVFIASPGGFLLRGVDMAGARNEAIDHEFSTGETS